MHDGKSVWRPSKIISGMQTGADMGGLKAARRLGIPTGGWAPKGYRTENGNWKSIGDLYGLCEHTSSNYAPRTEENVRDADATIIIVRADVQSIGSKLTQRLCCKYSKPWQRIMVTPLLSFQDSTTLFNTREWLNSYRPQILNIAGNRESLAPGIGGWTEMFLYTVLFQSNDGNSGGEAALRR